MRVRLFCTDFNCSYAHWQWLEKSRIGSSTDAMDETDERSSSPRVVIPYGSKGAIYGALGTITRVVQYASVGGGSFLFSSSCVPSVSHLQARCCLSPPKTVQHLERQLLELATSNFCCESHVDSLNDDKRYPWELKVSGGNSDISSEHHIKVT